MRVIRARADFNGLFTRLNVNVKNDSLNQYRGADDLTKKGGSRRKFQRYTTYMTVIIVVIAAAVAGYWIYQTFLKPRPKLPAPIILTSGTENEWYDPGAESWNPAVELTSLHPVWEKTIGPRGESVGIDAPWMWKTDMPLATEEEVAYDSVVTFRRKFTLLDGFKISGSIVITADNEYRLHINGNLVGSDTEVQDAETYDISPYLHPGENEITIEVVNLGMPEAWPDNPEWNPAGVIYQAEISYSV